MGFLAVGEGRCSFAGRTATSQTLGAKAALRTVALNHGLLHAVQLALVLEVFDADQLFAVQRRHKGQARVKAAITNLLDALIVAMQLADHHGARTAVAAGAAFLVPDLPTCSRR